MKALIAALLALLTLTLPSLAAPGTGAKKAFEISHQMVDVRDVRLQPYASLKLRGNFHIRYLMGEPVVGCAALWLNPGVSQVETEGGNRVLAEAGEEELYNLMLVAQFPNPLKGATRFTNGGGAFLSTFCDAGVVAQNGKSGFNVSGSPNWDQFLCATPFRVDTSRMNAINRQERDLCASVRGTWLTREEARKVAAGNIEITDVQVHGFELNNSDTVRRAEKMAWRKTSFARTKTKFKGVMTRLYDTLPQSSWVRFTGLGAEAQALERRVVGSPSATDVKAYDTLLDRALAELEAARAGEREAMQESWQAEDREMIGKQLTRVRGVDETLSRMDSAMARYEADLHEAAKDAPQLPEPKERVDPMAKYAVAEHKYSINHAGKWLTHKSGGLAVPYDHNFSYHPLSGRREKKYDIYVRSRSAGYRERQYFTILDSNLRPLGKERFYTDNWYKFTEKTGLMTFMDTTNNRDSVTLQIYSFSENRVVVDRTLRPGDDTFAINRLGSNQYIASAKEAVLSGRHILYMAPSALSVSPNQIGIIEEQCKAWTEDGEVNGVYPIIAYDADEHKLLPVSEHMCVPNPNPRQ
jgi:Zn-finger nucleic acid-binding protein